MWYVIQTSPGKETTVKTIIDNTMPRECYEECRIIYYEIERKYQGAWHKEQRKMFPGYLFLVSDHIEDVQLHLKKVPQMTKLLGDGKDVIPISAAEEAFLKKLSGEDSNVEFSSGIQVGDEIRIDSGSLKGLESKIRKIDRHKRKACIELEFLGETRLVEVGLEIVVKR